MNAVRTRKIRKNQEEKYDTGRYDSFNTGRKPDTGNKLVI